MAGGAATHRSIHGGHDGPRSGAASDDDAESLRRRLEALLRLVDLTGRLAAEHDLNAVLAAAADLACQAIGCDRATLFVYDESSDALVARVATELEVRFVVNSAGLGAVDLLRNIDGYPAERIPVMHFGRGNYFTVAERSPFRHLIYPVPHAAGLGIHATLDLGKRVRFGPDVEWIDHIDYSVNAARAPLFYEAIRRYWPRLADGALTPDYTGIRPKLHGPGEPQPDFRIESAADHGLPGLVNLLGIESPGLTSSLAIGDYAASFA